MTHPLMSAATFWGFKKKGSLDIENEKKKKLMKFNWLSKVSEVGNGCQGRKGRYYFRLYILRCKLLISGSGLPWWSSG